MHLSEYVDVWDNFDCETTATLHFCTLPHMLQKINSDIRAGNVRGHLRAQNIPRYTKYQAAAGPAKPGTALSRCAVAGPRDTKAPLARASGPGRATPPPYILHIPRLQKLPNNIPKNIPKKYISIGPALIQRRRAEDNMMGELG